MKQVLFLSLVVVPLQALAQEPIQVPAALPAATGKVLVLENERTLEGDIERIGDQYRIRRAIGETWLPSDRALRLCASIEDAYLFLRGRSNLRDADERLKLAEWCHNHGLRPQALAEVQAAVNLRPNHPASQRLLSYLRQQATEPQPATPPAPPIPDIDSHLALNVELTGEALGQFTARVQPILMNSCAACHATGRGGPFKLTRTHDLGNQRVTQQNLVSVLATLNPRQPESSPFLTNALSLHGGMTQAPFRNRQAPAYRALEEWVRLTIANNAQAVESVRGEAPHTQSSTATPPATATPAVLAEHHPTPSSAPPGPAAGSPSPTPVAPPAPMPAAMPSPQPVPDDPNDPEIFNQGAAPAQPVPLPQPPARPRP